MSSYVRNDINALEWDSNFFGIRVGSLNADNIPLPELTRLLVETDLDLVYLFKQNVTFEEKSAILSLGGVFVGKRVCLRKHLDECDSSEGVNEVREISNEILELAFLSGELSRFNKDCYLQKFFKPMYRAWLEKDFYNGKVFVCGEESCPKGVASVHVEGGVGRIGLVSVSKTARRKGIGRKLLNSVCDWLFRKGVCLCDVVTQGDNVAALSLYLNSGFSVTSSAEVFHVWRRG